MLILFVRPRAVPALAKQVDVSLPKSHQWELDRVDHLLCGERFQEAADAAQAFIDRIKADPSGVAPYEVWVMLMHRSRARTGLGLGELALDDITQVFSVLRQLGTESPDAHYVFSLALEAAGQKKDAALAIKEWGNMVFKSRPDLSGAGNMLFRAYNKAVELDPKLASAHSNRGMMLRIIGRFKESVQAYRLAERLATKQGNRKLAAKSAANVAKTEQMAAEYDAML